MASFEARDYVAKLFELNKLRAFRISMLEPHIVWILKYNIMGVVLSGVKNKLPVAPLTILHAGGPH